MHDIPIIPEEWHIIMNDKLIKSTICNFSMEVLGALVLQWNNLPSFEVYLCNIKSIFNFYFIFILYNIRYLIFRTLYFLSLIAALLVTHSESNFITCIWLLQKILIKASSTHLWCHAVSFKLILVLRVDAWNFVKSVVVESVKENNHFGLWVKWDFVILRPKSQDILWCYVATDQSPKWILEYQLALFL